MGYKRTTAGHYQAKGLYFPKSDSQKQCPLDFSTAVISLLLLMRTGYGCDIFDFVSSIQLFPIWCILCSRFSNSANFISSVGSKQPTNSAQQLSIVKLDLILTTLSLLL